MTKDSYDLVRLTERVAVLEAIRLEPSAEETLTVIAARLNDLNETLTRMNEILEGIRENLDNVTDDQGYVWIKRFGE